LNPAAQIEGAASTARRENGTATPLAQVADQTTAIPARGGYMTR
jgi:hypothetical protein